MSSEDRGELFGRSRSTRRWPHGRLAGVTISVSLAIILATAAWISLVFSGGIRRPSWYQLKEWEGSPASFFPWQPGDGALVNVSGPSDGESRQNSGREPRGNYEPLSLRHILFGIAGSAQLWSKRKEFVRLWWSPGKTIGHVWLEEKLSDYDGHDEGLPPIRISEDISRFRYTNPTGHPSGLRISRIVKESFQLGLPGVRWFVLGDDDTIFNPDNLIRVLAKYDPSEMFYIGGPSESHSANTYFSHSMAFGGGGIAISYPLAEAISEMQDECLERYPKLYGSDDRLHACISELGVPLTREYGFHQWDIRGSAHGLLAAHPIAPLVSIHHVEAVDPLYPGLNSLDSLRLFTRAMKVDPLSFLQRSVCYDRKRQLTFAVSLGYVVQVFPNIVLPRDLERSEQTYMAWNRLSDRNEFDFDMRDAYRSRCKRPVLFFLKDVGTLGNSTLGMYGREKGNGEFKRRVFCFPRTLPLRDVEDIQVIGKPLSEKWHLFPRRLCCRTNVNASNSLRLIVGQCERRKLTSIAEIV